MKFCCWERRKLYRYTPKKEPITPEILKQIVTKYGTTFSNLKDLRLEKTSFIELTDLRKSDKCIKYKET
jgi:hypothetical protein